MRNTRRSRRAAFAAFAVAASLLATSPVLVQAKDAKTAPSAPQAPTAPAPPITVNVNGKNLLLPDGTIVKMQLTKTLSSSSAKVGDTVEYVVEEDVMDTDKNVLIRKGTAGVGEVTVAGKKKMFGKPGKLDFTCDSVVAVDGSKIALRGEQTASGKSRRSSMVAASLLIMPFFVFMKGKDITIKQGTVVTAYADSTPALAAAPAGGK